MQMSGRTAELSFNGKRTFEFTMEAFYIHDKWKINVIKFCVILAIVQMTEYVFFPSLHNSSGSQAQIRTSGTFRKLGKK